MICYWWAQVSDCAPRQCAMVEKGRPGAGLSLDKVENGDPVSDRRKQMRAVGAE